MEITLQRSPSRANATIGTLTVAGSKFTCFTCEDVIRERAGVPVAQWKVQDKTAIPAGRYRVVVAFSPHFQRDLPHLVDVPGYDGILIHPGNTAEDTKGCILPGYSHYVNTVGRSRAAFEDLFALIQAAGDQVWISVSNPVSETKAA